MNYRIIQTDDSITVLTEDGGLAEIRLVEELVSGDGRKTTIEYYQNRFTEEDLNNPESVYDILGEGKMYYNDYTTPYTSPEHITDALEWLAPGNDYKSDNTLWPSWREL